MTEHGGDRSNQQRHGEPGQQRGRTRSRYAAPAAPSAHSIREPAILVANLRRNSHDYIFRARAVAR
ncbi:hypothetical protein [Flexivirga oryzae]|uniref:Uncharacterized protein n=1 Tax=Flexivirga oryzae TaxID=1794944 RepID=A0A839N008_9MICO|nr:hypothetical protein [Flexivirga oryzae]MBB2891050.1 hypothetical protein [Flexivirga oryzae]